MLRKIMTVILIVFGVLCLLYFGMLWAKHVHFCEIWLIFGILFCLAGAYLKMRDRFCLPGWIEGGILVCAVCGFLIFAFVQGQILSAMKMPKGQVDYLIVLGAQVKGSVPSKALNLRLECARDYMKDNPEVVAVLSGGQGDGEDITEAQCMYEYLVSQGISADQLRLEDKSTTTKENLIFSAQLLGNVADKKIGLVTNNFHVYRAVKFAKKLGYTDVVGIPARSDAKLQVHYLVREFFALLKEFLKSF